MAVQYIPAVEQHGVELAHRGLAAPGGTDQQQGLLVAEAPPGQPEKPPHVSAVRQKDER